LAARGETGILVRETRLEDRLSIYIPKGKTKHRPVERLIKLGQKMDRSVKYLVVEAIVQYLERGETWLIRSTRNCRKPSGRRKIGGLKSRRHARSLSNGAAMRGLDTTGAQRIASS
jgi:hypothetical protein